MDRDPGRRAYQKPLDLHVRFSRAGELLQPSPSLIFVAYYSTCDVATGGVLFPPPQKIKKQVDNGRGENIPRDMAAG